MGSTEAIFAGISLIRGMQSARSQNRQLATQQALQERQIAATRQIEERRRKEQLRLNKAAHRARFGGLGISASGGSAAAVLQGLSTRSDLDRQDRDRLSSLRLQGLRQNFAFQRRRNLLAPRNAFFDRALGALERRGPQIFGS